MKIKVRFSNTTQRISPKMGEVHTVTKYLGGEEYDGAYEVTPKFKGQTMPTKDKVLREDMTIKAIPIYSVSNTSGGTTVFIGNEV